MIEALVAGIILIVFLVTIRASYLSVTPQEEASAEAYMTLKSLDQSGLLRDYAVANDYNGLNSEIKDFWYNHSVEICNPSSCSGEKPSADDVYVGSYLISGGDGYAPRIVNLYLWREL